MGCCIRNDYFYSFCKKNCLVHSNCREGDINSSIPWTIAGWSKGDLWSSWMNPGLGMGTLRLSQLAVRTIEFRAEGTMCKQRRASKETSGEIRNQTSTDLRCLTKFWFLSGLVISTPLCKEHWRISWNSGSWKWICRRNIQAACLCANSLDFGLSRCGQAAGMGT